MTNLLRMICIIACISMMANIYGQDDEIFNEYPWIESVIDIENCDGVTIKVFSSGNSEFVFICKASGNHMYSKTGDVYCISYTGFDCLDYYGFTSPIKTYTCNTMSEGTDIFNDYPWLKEFINSSDCTNESITAYTTGYYDYVSVSSEGNTVLYNAEGDQYCIDGQDFSCIDFYGLEIETDNWECGEESGTGEGQGEGEFLETECGTIYLSSLDWIQDLYNEFSCEQNYQMFYGCKDGELLFYWVTNDYTISDLNRIFYTPQGEFLCSDAPNSPTDSRCTEYYGIDWDFDNPLSGSDCDFFVFTPVCGTDGKTYRNECIATCAGIEIAYEGECSCECEDDTYDPVCTYSGETYNNACEAICDNQGIQYEGECVECIMPTLEELPWLETLLEDPYYCDCLYEALPACNSGVSFVALFPRFDSPCTNEALAYYYTLEGELICTEDYSNPSDCPEWDNLAIYLGEFIIWTCD